MAQGRETNRAAVQGASLLVVAVGAASMGWRMHASPLDAERLHLEVSQLASFASEARELARRSAQRRLPARLAKNHARQLADAFGRSVDRLESSAVQPALRPEQESALTDSRAALAEVEKQAKGEPAGPLLARSAERLSHQAKGLQDAMP